MRSTSPLWIIGILYIWLLVSKEIQTLEVRSNWVKYTTYKGAAEITTKHWKAEIIPFIVKFCFQHTLIVNLWKFFMTFLFIQLTWSQFREFRCILGNMLIIFQWRTGQVLCIVLPMGWCSWNILHAGHWHCYKLHRRLELNILVFIKIYFFWCFFSNILPWQSSLWPQNVHVIACAVIFPLETGFMPLKRWLKKVWCYFFLHLYFDKKKLKCRISWSTP